jgi:hypothetical protein
MEACNREEDVETQSQPGFPADNQPLRALHRQSDPTPGAARLQRRRRLHELVLALIGQQGDLELLDGDALLGSNSGSSGIRDPAKRDPASWLDHNRRLIQRYQALVRTAATLDALIDQEVGEGPSA